MNEVVPFSYPRIGNLIVLGDGPELLVYSGANDQGMWKAMCTDIIMGVGATQDHVFAMLADGRLMLYRALDGAELSRLDTDTSPWSLAVSADGVSAIVTASSVVIVRFGTDPLTVTLPSPRVVAWGPDSGSLGVGCSDGSFFAVDPTTGASWGSIRLGQPITGVVWRTQGHWLVSHGQQVSVVRGDGTTVESVLPADGPVSGVSCSADGALVATIVGQQRVDVMEMVNKLPVGTVTFQRTVHHLQFGPGHWLGFGFDEGDANRLELATGKMTRTLAHAGRAQNGWSMVPQLNAQTVRGAIASVATGGAAIAKEVKRKRPSVLTKKRNPYLLVGVLVGGGALLCCGSGMVVGLWFGLSDLLMSLL